MKTKKAGLERPYTCKEFVRIINEIAKEKKLDYLDMLDYFVPHKEEETIQYDDVDIVSETHYGGGEGIYSAFYLRRGGERMLHLATAKTLGESEEDWMAMNILAAQLCWIGSRYICEHSDEFLWSYFTVKDVSEKHCCGYICATLDNAKKKADEMIELGGEPVIIDNSTRKKIN